MSSSPPLTIEHLAFRLQQLPGVGAAKLRKILAGIRARGQSAEDFVALDEQALIASHGLSPVAAKQLACPSPAEDDIWEKLAAQGVKLLVQGWDGYPERLTAMLGDTAPPVLYIRGATELLTAPGVGFCGSRKASDKGLGVAGECARLLSADRINIVSGYAHGVDLAAHCAALEAGGTTTVVLAEGILHFRIKEQVRQWIRGEDFSNLVVVSEFPPNLPWKAHNAMIRNRTICGLSNVLVVIESGLEGGTFEAAKTALALKEPLFCVEYADPAESAAGNSWLVEHGAIRLRRSRSGQPNLAGIVEAISHRPTAPARVGRQQGDLLHHAH
ncbi:MAG: DNA-processing protein DprA [Sulfuritalea sp.]|nr:DNA-processing protein DprA [Sulfuritalea sp.]